MSNEKDTVLIMRGPSGSGKSYFVDEFLKHHGMPRPEGDFIRPEVCSTDHYFWMPQPDDEPKYIFDPSKLGKAHSTCLKKYLGQLKMRQPIIVVDNTNVHWWEFQNYVWALSLLSDEYQLIVVSCHPTTVVEMQEFAGRQEHGVDSTIVAKQTIEFEDFKSFREHMPMSLDFQFFTDTSYWRNQRDINQ